MCLNLNKLLQVSFLIENYFLVSISRYFKIAPSRLEFKKPALAQLYCTFCVLFYSCDDFRGLLCSCNRFPVLFSSPNTFSVQFDGHNDFPGAVLLRQYVLRAALLPQYPQRAVLLLGTFPRAFFTAMIFEGRFNITSILLLS